MDRREAAYYQKNHYIRTGKNYVETVKIYGAIRM